MEARRPQKILVTGGTGFIGSRIVEAFAGRPEFQVYFTGRRSLEGISGAEFLRGDLTDPSFAARVCAGMDFVVHCAGKAGTWGSYGEFFAANVLATRLLLEGARAGGVRRVVNISSPSIYFDFKDQFDLREGDLPPRFSNAYARTKFEAEELMRAAHGAELQTVSLRPRLVIGRGDQTVFPRLMRLVRAGGLIQVGGGRNIVDVTSIGNLVDAIELCLSAPAAAMGEVYNISNGAPVVFWDFVEEVLHAAGLPLRRRRLPYVPVMALARVNEVLSRVLRRSREPAFLPISIGSIAFSMTLDISKARERLGYSPRFSTRDAIDEFFSPGL